MREQDIKTIRAFLIALSQLESPLDESLQKQLNQLAKELATDVELAIENLRKLIYKHDFLKILYQPALKSLQLAYQAQPRNKCILPLEDSEPSSENLELENFLLPTDSLKLFQYILKSNDSVQITKDTKTQLQSSPETPSIPPTSPDSSPSNSVDVYSNAWVYTFV
ncbi:hypothetical protein [Argonema antarcticum]|uniref:hypothetical protein n=1 Tax=Argonema antarcticum TaxID=2942763 RepID=UPI00201370BB|nr:hypothetical protein [Argonema antarcticum]MCL1473960.1 hypothetical protein [Argonema antarcticum A004/B2]